MNEEYSLKGLSMNLHNEVVRKSQFNRVFSLLSLSALIVITSCASPYQRGVEFLSEDKYAEARRAWSEVSDPALRKDLLDKLDVAADILLYEERGTRALRRGDISQAKTSFKSALVQNKWRENWESREVLMSIRRCRNELLRIYLPELKMLEKDRRWLKLQREIDGLHEVAGSLSYDLTLLKREADTWIQKSRDAISKGDLSVLSGDRKISQNDISSSTFDWYDAIKYLEEAQSMVPEYRDQLNRKISSIRKKIEKHQMKAFVQIRSELSKANAEKRWDDVLKYANINREAGLRMHNDIGFENEMIRRSKKAIALAEAIRTHLVIMESEHGLILDKGGFITMKSPTNGTGDLKPGKIVWRWGEADSKAWGVWNDVEASFPVDFNIKLLVGTKQNPSVDKTTGLNENVAGKSLAVWRKADPGIIHFVLTNRSKSMNYYIEANVYKTLETDF